jgi:two-component system cell cycle response regulator DivK
MSKTVLIADDYADVRSMTKYLVESCGYDVIEARDGFEALDKARARRPDLILMDVAMPQMNGITSATLIRSAKDCENIPIIAVTAHGREYMEHEEDFGFDHIVQKPVLIDDLKQLLDRYLGGERDH